MTYDPQVKAGTIEYFPFSCYPMVIPQHLEYHALTNLQVSWGEAWFVCPSLKNLNPSCRGFVGMILRAHGWAGPGWRQNHACEYLRNLEQ